MTTHNAATGVALGAGLMRWHRLDDSERSAHRAQTGCRPHRHPETGLRVAFGRTFNRVPSFAREVPCVGVLDPFIDYVSTQRTKSLCCPKLPGHVTSGAESRSQLQNWKIKSAFSRTSLDWLSPIQQKQEESFSAQFAVKPD